MNKEQIIMKKINDVYMIPSYMEKHVERAIKEALREIKEKEERLNVK